MLRSVSFHLGLHCLSKSQGDTLIFSYIRRLGSFWGGGVKNFEFQYFGGFQKNEYFGGFVDFVYFFLEGGGER